MAYTCALAGSDEATFPMFNSIFSMLSLVAVATVARLDVVELGRLAPDVLVCDVDRLDVDPLEMLRRIRFVLPQSVIAVYTDNMQRAWGVACHLAGVNCMLSKGSDECVLSNGIRSASAIGCYTDPRFTEKRDGSKAVSDFALFKNATSRIRPE